MKTKTSLTSLIAATDWYYKNPNITEANFPAPEKIQTEGGKMVTLPRYMTGDEVLTYLKEQGLRPANVYELLTYFNEHKEELKGTYKWYPAFGQTWTDSGGYRRVPCVSALSGGDFDFDLGYFERGWRDEDVLLCFCDEPSDTQTPTSSSEPLDLISRIEKIEAVLKHHNLGA